MNGVIQGGWEFVTAAYLVSAAVLGAYGASVFLRFKAETRREAREEALEPSK
jgi:hypothetical protein